MHRFITICFLLLLAGATLAQHNSTDLSGPWELMVDDYIIEHKENVIREYHPFQKHPGNPLLVADRPWEGTTSYLYGTVLPAEEREQGYRMWYHAWMGEYTNLYAVSKDGLHWDKPSLGLINFRGSRDNNIFVRRTKEDHLPQVIYTPWEADTAKRYKLINYDYGRTSPDHLVTGFWGAYSADGIHWTDVAKNPVLKDPGDVGNFTWDPHTRSYIGYPKIFAPVNGFNRRCVGYTATTDFENWPSAQLILVPDSADDRWITEPGQRTEFYGLSGFAYQSGYLGFLWIFKITDGNNDGPIYCELVSSRDGIRWTRQEVVDNKRTPILSLGAAGTWDQGMVFSTNHPLVEKDQVKLWYGGSSITHGDDNAGSSGIGLATLKKHRFASLNASKKLATVTTNPIDNLKGKLYVNAEVGNGKLQVEVLDALGKVLSGYERNACIISQNDGIEMEVRWKKNKELPAEGKGLRLRFVFQKASLYAFRCDEVLRLSRPEVTEPILLSKDSMLFTSQESGIVLPKVIPNSTMLGPQFTLSAMVKASGDKRCRLFSNYRGSGSFVTGELIFDFDASGRSDQGIRFIVNGQSVASAPLKFNDGQYHQLTVTYDYGKTIIYFDGKPIAFKQLDAGAAHLYNDRSVKSYFDLPGALQKVGIYLGNDLLIGSDITDTFMTYRHKDKGANEAQMRGAVKNILVTTKIISPQQISHD